MALYRYPSTIEGTNSSYLLFTRIKHNGVITTDLRSVNDNNFKVVGPQDAIALPVPNNFSDVITSNYGNIDAIGADLGDVASKALSVAQDKALGSTANQLANFGTQSTRANTQSAIYYENTSIKTFDFSWDLIPESLEEAQNIENIIKLFQLISLPSSNSGSIGTKFPDLLKIKQGGVKSRLVNFMPCVITNVTSNLTPNGYYQIYKDGYLPHINFTLSVSEYVSRTQEIQNRLMS